MEYFAPGFRELQRMAARGALQLRLVLTRRHLAAAETELGQLGWQQADFDDHTERQVDEIQHVEREQARLHNASAELAHKIQALTAERTRLRQEHEAQRAQLEPERDKSRASLAEAATRLAALKKAETERGRRVEEIKRTQLKLEEEHSDLLEIQPQTPQVRDEMVVIHDRQIVFSTELREIDWQRSHFAAELDKENKEHAELERQCALLDGQLREAASAAGSADGKLADELREIEKEKAKVAAESEKLERAKLNPYREIGRVLADSRVAPANQPEALRKVLGLRGDMENLLTVVAALQAATAREDPVQLRMSFALLVVIVLALALLIGSLM